MAIPYDNEDNLTTEGEPTQVQGEPPTIVATQDVASEEEETDDPGDDDSA